MISIWFYSIKIYTTSVVTQTQTEMVSQENASQTVAIAVVTVGSTSRLSTVFTVDAGGDALFHTQVGDGLWVFSKE